MVTLQNDQLAVQLNPTGAELHSLVLRSSGLDYMWCGDPARWGKKSPLLFPIVGTLKNNTYFYEGRDYQLGRHGFAREKKFSVDQVTDQTATFILLSDEQTKLVYPFDFELVVHYALMGATLAVTYTVRNTGHKPLLFSLGGHPAFAVPLENNLNYTDYYLEFNHDEIAPRWPITKDGLLIETPVPFFDKNRRLNLDKSLFYEDALVFKHLNSDRITLGTSGGPHGLHFNFPGFPYLGIWAAKHADFVCLEPWCGIADGVGTNQQLDQKEGIQQLNEAQDWQRGWSVEVF